MTLHNYIFNVNFDFYYTVLSLFHQLRVFMHINIHMLFDCMHFAACFFFFFAFTMKKISDVIELNHLCRPTFRPIAKESVCLEKGEINKIFIAPKVIVVY